MLKNGKFANCNERQNRKTEKFNPPSPPPHAFVYQIDYSTRGANISFLIEVFATNKHSEHREIPFYFSFCEASRVLFLLWDISVFLKGS